MAGIGFELRRYLGEGSYLGLVKAYGYAGLISAGPWVLSILGVLGIGLLGLLLRLQTQVLVAFLVSVTYLMAASLILSGALQLLLTRYVADRLYERWPGRVLPNLMGGLLLTALACLGVGALLWPAFAGTSLGYRLLMLAAFTLLSMIWLLVIMVSGLRAHRRILLAFFVGYGLTVAGAVALRHLGLEGLLLGFLLGQGVLFFLLLGLVVWDYPGDGLLQLDFLRPGRSHPSLALVGLAYNAAIWADKLLFWFHPHTTQAVHGPLRASAVYDPPVFLAYLAIVPGMAVFLLRMEADFVERYEAFYGAIRGGDTLDHIREGKALMMDTLRQGLLEILKVQGFVCLLLVAGAATVLGWFGIPAAFARLFAVDAVGVGAQVLLLALLNVLFYLDERRLALGVTLLFLAANAGLSWLSLALGPAFYGYGFALAVVLAAVVAMHLVNRVLARLEYDTFMLRG